MSCSCLSCLPSAQKPQLFGARAGREQRWCSSCQHSKGRAGGATLSLHLLVGEPVTPAKGNQGGWCLQYCSVRRTETPALCSFSASSVCPSVLFCLWCSLSFFLSPPRVDKLHTKHLSIATSCVYGADCWVRWQLLPQQAKVIVMCSAGRVTVCFACANM